MGRGHSWRIDETEYRRHEQRRGRRHAFEVLDPERTALLVVDMIPFFIDELPTARAIVATIQHLADRLRRAGGMVVWVAPGDDPLSDARREFYGDEVAERYRRSGGGTAAAKLAANFDLDRVDTIAEKTAPSALAHDDTTIEPLLQANRIETVVVVGVTADVCVESTVRDASTRGYRTIVVGDAVAAGSDAVVNAALRTIYRSFGDVRSAGEVLDLLATDSRPQPRRA